LEKDLDDGTKAWQLARYPTANGEKALLPLDRIIIANKLKMNY
jgi:hypothetical protein